MVRYGEYGELYNSCNLTKFYTEKLDRKQNIRFVNYSERN